MNSKMKLTLLGLLIISSLVDFFLTISEDGLTGILIRYNIIKVEQHTSYGALSYEQLINNADVVFVGKLQNVSVSKWNQDSGEYWMDDESTTAVVQYHTLTFDVSQFIINKTKSPDLKSIEITVLGPSPLDENADYSLSIGDNLVVFARETELAWKEGNHRKPILEIETAPEFAFFIQINSPDGPYNGKIIHDLGKGDFTTEDISLPLQDLISQIQSIDKNQ